MAKYSVPDDAWEDDEPEGPPAWKEDTSAVSIEIDVQLHDRETHNMDVEGLVPQRCATCTLDRMAERPADNGEGADDA